MATRNSVFRHFPWVAGFVALALGLVMSSCAARGVGLAVEDLVSAERAPSKPVRLFGYTTRDDEFHPFDGQVVSAGPDSLEFFAEYRSATRVNEERPEARFRVARSTVKSLHVSPSTTKSVSTLIGVLALLGVAGALWLIISGANLFGP